MSYLCGTTFFVEMRYLFLILKGCAMGTADVIPGVSGGTIAFISGIYGELIESFRRIGSRDAWTDLARFRLARFWSRINGNFLAAVFAGVLLAVFSLAGVMTRLLEHHPIGVWAFFFGLIVASSLLVAREVGRWDSIVAGSLAVGIAAAWQITAVSPAETPDTWWFVFLSGAIAVCAMILPGISGAFILLLMGKYRYILSAVSALNIPVLAIFAAGAVAGLLGFSHLLSWLLRRHHDRTVALLMGFMIGSLNKVWPWKQTITAYVDSHGAQQPLVQQNVLPATFESLTGTEAHTIGAIGLAICGFLLIWGVETIGKYLRK